MTDTPFTYPSKFTRRNFLIIVTGSTVAILTGCRPESDSPPPTLYQPGSLSPITNSPSQQSALAADPRYSYITHDQILITDNRYFYVQSYNNDIPPTQSQALNEWKLRVDGLVENPLELTYEQIRQFPEVEVMRTLECIGNPVGGSLIGNATWGGFWFEEILNRVQVKSTATRARFHAWDGYETAVDLEWITQPNVLMAYKMNGQLLPREHGYPLRIFMPGLYGQKMPKWIDRIEFIDYDFQGVWEQGGWSDVAAVQTNSIIQSPPNQTEIRGQIVIQGVSFAGKRRITQVEIRVNGGAWLSATLTQNDSPLVWTQWVVQWTPSGDGTYEIEVRATDETGFTQRSDADGALGNAKPAGTNAIHRIVVGVI